MNIKKLIVIILLVEILLFLFACNSKVTKDKFEIYQNSILELHYHLPDISTEADELIYSVYNGEKTLNQIIDEITNIKEEYETSIEVLDEIKLPDELSESKNLLKDAINARLDVITLATSDENEIRQYSLTHFQSEENEEHIKMISSIDEYIHKIDVYYEINYIIKQK